MWDRWSAWIAVAVLLAVAACGKQTFDLHGQAALTRLLSKPDHDGGCLGILAYSDLRVGGPVRVYDDSGTQVASGLLGQGTYNGDRCVFPLTLLAVPDGSRTYTVAVGEGRGEWTYSADMAKSGQVSVTVG